MDWSELSAKLMASPDIPAEIKDDSKRLNDFLLGAKTALKFLVTTFGDDLK